MKPNLLPDKIKIKELISKTQVWKPDQTLKRVLRHIYPATPAKYVMSDDTLLYLIYYVKIKLVNCLSGIIA